MQSVVPLVLRRMRQPLILVISAYAVSVLGFTLIPGADDAGQPVAMGFFHAFYFVSYMATTIGFGEIPNEFTEAQRMWALVALYLTVIAWFYALVNIISLIQDPAFRQAREHGRFRRAVERIGDPFYLICGYGDTGAELARALTERGRQVVAVDIARERIDALRITELPLFVPGLCGDANLTDNLLAAGLMHRHCLGVIAVTNSNQSNLQIAISARLLRPSLRVICRAEQRQTVANMKSFGTDYVVNPFEAFAVNVVTAMRSADLQRIEEWLTSLPGAPLPEPAQPPRGRWVICGYGRAGEALYRLLRYQGVEAAIVDPAPLAEPEEALRVQGKGSEAVTLRAAHVTEATAVFAATHNDADNLSILMTARELNPGLFLVARQNNRWSDAVFAAAGLPLVMTPSHIMAAEILSELAAPLLADFLRYSRHQRPEWARRLTQALREIAGGRVPEVWMLTLNEQEAPALVEALRCDRQITVGVLGLDPRRRELPLPCLPLLLRRGKDDLPLPEPALPLAAGDRLLLCAREGARSKLGWTLRNHNALNYVLSGEQRPDGWLWRLLRKERTRPGPG